jgi:hypothetical protein
MFRLLCFAIIRLLHYLLDACKCKTIGCDMLVISRESVGMTCIISKLIIICYLHVSTIFLKAYIYITLIVCKLFVVPFVGVRSFLLHCMHCVVLVLVSPIHFYCLSQGFLLCAW